MHERSQLPTGSVTNKLEDVVAARFFRVSMISSAHFLLQTGSRETVSGLIQVQRKSVFFCFCFFFLLLFFCLFLFSTKQKL